MSGDSVETPTLSAEEKIANNENEEMLSGSDSEDNANKEKDISPQKDGKLIKQIIREGKGLKKNKPFFGCFH